MSIINIFKNKQFYTEEEKKWASLYENKINEHNLPALINLTVNEKNSDLSILLSLSENNDKMRSFFINEYVKSSLDALNSIIGKKLKATNETPEFKYKFVTNNDILKTATKNINLLYQNFDTASVNNILNENKNREKIDGIAVDKNLSHFIISLIENNVNLDHNKLLNMSIRSGNKDLFDVVINSFQGKKENFENLQDNPFFWQPLLLTNQQRELTKYFYDQLFENKFELKQSDLESMLKLSASNPSKEKYYKDLSYTIKNKSQNQKTFKF